MKYVFNNGRAKIKGEVDRVAGPAPVVGGDFIVTLQLADKHMRTYSGKIDEIKDGVVYFS